MNGQNGFTPSTPLSKKGDFDSEWGVINKRKNAYPKTR